MKKLLILVAGFFVLLLLSIYIFIPQKLEISKTEHINCNINGAYRLLSDKNSWNKWWPVNDSLKSQFIENSFFYNGYSYHLSDTYYNSIQITITSENFSITTRIDLMKINPDSTFLAWNCQVPVSRNPITRVLNFIKAGNVRRDMGEIVSTLRSFLQKKENVYGFNFYRIMSQDSTMVAIKKTTNAYPATAEIYDLINSLKKYINRGEAKENNFPMLNIKKLKNQQFETMVAIPVNKELEGNGKIFFSRFVPWYVLCAEVRGGDYTVNHALQQMEIYISDYQKIPMAIPFQSLVTNRLIESDTTNWITNIYTPIPN
jgi:hypothetical protein